jgi:hypothetical protein
MLALLKRLAPHIDGKIIAIFCDFRGADVGAMRSIRPFGLKAAVRRNAARF